MELRRGLFDVQKVTYGMNIVARLCKRVIT